MAVVAAFELGAERVLAIDPIAERRAFAAAFGAETAASTDAEELLAGPLHSAERGVAAVVEAVGSAASTRLAFDLLRAGGVLSSVGVHTRPEFGFTPVEAYDKNLTLRAGRCSARPLMEELTPLVLSRRWDLASIVTHRLPLAEGAAAYRLVASHSGGCAKVLLEVA
jgi:threonine dehydrogenase-like Zn-dependent dehydrogenase